MRRAVVAAGIIVVVAVIALIITRGGGEQRYAASATILESRDHGPELCLGGVLESYPPQCGGLPLVGWDWADIDGEESASGTTWTEAYVEGTYDGTQFRLTAPPGPPRPPDPAAQDPLFTPACDDPEAVDEKAGIAEWEEALQRDNGALNRIPNLVAIWVTGTGPEDDEPFVANVVVRPGSGAEARTYVREYWPGRLCLVERDQRPARELDRIMERLDDVLTQEILSASPNDQRGVVEATFTVVDDEARREVGSAFGEGVVELTGQLKPI